MFFMKELDFSTKPKWVAGAKSGSIDFLLPITKVSGAVPLLSSSPVPVFYFGHHFPEEYFLGKKKESFIADLAATDCAASCYKAFIELCESLPLTSSDRSMCVSVLRQLFIVNSNWFLMPTSSTGKYHGGVLGIQNTVGGIYQHSLALCNLANSVLKRYAEVIDSLELDKAFMPSALLSCCILHDIGKMNLSQSTIYSVADHGEVAASFIESLDCGARSSLLYAIGNHMYGWKAINVFNHIVVSGASIGLVLLFMLCECDFFGSV